MGRYRADGDGLAVIALRAERYAEAVFGEKDRTTSGLRLHIVVLRDPRLLLTHIPSPVILEPANVRAFDLLDYPPNDARSARGFNPTFAEFKMQLGGEVADKLPILRGYFDVMGDANPLVMDIEHPAEAGPLEEEVAFGKVRVAFATPAGKGDEVRLRVALEWREGASWEKDPAPWASERSKTTPGYAYLDELRLVGADGKSLPLVDRSEVYRMSQDGWLRVGYELRYRSANGKAPARLQWCIPRQLRAMRIPFELRDVPMPR